MQQAETLTHTSNLFHTVPQVPTPTPPHKSPRSHTRM